ncbi:hypothetical protein RHMOL_Rhmol01G0288300 [Rhododendron molle]|uniref:Uncharacterized protein n=1 Tax=Rhododendron molle TaxID=49168 RepID=A0ACC0Q802_RHOML|nr:hypothetical protein RHMOL_Rhmol01G0288300 [Rhododendron molle]
MKYDTSPLRQIRSGAAPLGKDLMAECAKNFPQAIVIQGFGMTKTCGIISMEDDRKSLRNSGSVGTVVAGVECQIISVKTQKPLPPKHLGEIWARGANMMQGYFNNPQATRLTINKKGWVHTGDLGYFDEEGQLIVVDRLKELIKYKGFQSGENPPQTAKIHTSPATIVAKSMKKDGVAVVAVVGVNARRPRSEFFDFGFV